jgi:hypothetical protein
MALYGIDRFLLQRLAMLSPVTFPIRVECPPGACVCDRERLLEDPQADLRVLRLTREEEKRLLERIEAVDSYAGLLHLSKKMQEQLGIALHIAPGANEVRTVRGLGISLEQTPGLCKKTRQNVPAAVRRCLDRHPEIVYAILDAHDLLGTGDNTAQ